MPKFRHRKGISVLAIEESTAERALTSCKSLKDSDERKRSQLLDNIVRAKGTAERALTPCYRSIQPKGNRVSFQSIKCKQKG